MVKIVANENDKRIVCNGLTVCCINASVSNSLGTHLEKILLYKTQIQQIQVVYFT